WIHHHVCQWILYRIHGRLARILRSEDRLNRQELCHPLPGGSLHDYNHWWYGPRPAGFQVCRARAARRLDRGQLDCVRSPDWWNTRLGGRLCVSETRPVSAHALTSYYLFDDGFYII